jgi:HK97 family phage portal protein
MTSYSISGNSRAPLMLTGGLKPAQLTVNQKDAEVLATRLFTVEEICRIFGVPPHMVGHTDKTTSWGSGIEQQGIGFVRYTLQRHLTPIAQELNRKLWPTRSRYFVEHVTAALERGDLKSRYEAYRIAIGRAGEAAWIDEQEIRRLENMAPNDSLRRNPGANDTGAQDAPQ